MSETTLQSKQCSQVLKQLEVFYSGGRNNSKGELFSEKLMSSLSSIQNISCQPWKLPLKTGRNFQFLYLPSLNYLPRMLKLKFFSLLMCSGFFDFGQPDLECVCHRKEQLEQSPTPMVPWQSTFLEANLWKDQHFCVVLQYLECFLNLF